MSLELMLLAATGNATKPDLSKFFSIDHYVGNGTSTTVTDGIDRTDGVPVLDIFRPPQNGTLPFTFTSTVRGIGKHILSNSASPEVSNAAGVTGYTSTGLTLGSLANMNGNGATIQHIAFKEQDKFFVLRVISHVSGTAETEDLSKLGTVGMVMMKRLDNNSNWITHHRSLSTNFKFAMNSTIAPASDTTFFTISGTTLTMASAATTGTYLVCGWAHDTGVDGNIVCDLVSSTGSDQAVSLGWDPQVFFSTKSSGSDSRLLIDNLNAFTSRQAEYQLFNAPGQGNYTNVLKNRTRNGVLVVAVSTPLLYMAVRNRPKAVNVPTDVADVVAQAGNLDVAAAFTPDVLIYADRASGGNVGLINAWRGRAFKYLSAAVAESTVTPSNTLRRSQTGLVGGPSTSGSNLIYWMLREADGFLALENYIGTGATTTMPHRLGVVPEMIWVNSQNFDAGETGQETSYTVRGPGMSNNESVLTHSSAGKDASRDFWGGGTIGTSTTFNLGNGDTYTNYAGVGYQALLFASKPGFSKCTSYTGNGSSQTINCGFSNGARMVLIKRLDSSGQWYMFDSARGIVAGNDPYMTFQAAEVTTNDTIDPDSSGFIVNQNATTDLNVNGATYLVFALA